MRLFMVGLVLAMVLAVAGPVAAQEATPASPDASAAATPAAVTLVPLTNEAYGFGAVVPDGWDDLGNGIYARQESAADPVVLAMQSAPMPPDALLDTLLPQLLLSEAPDPVGTYQGATLEWTVYQVDVDTPQGTLRVDLALANVDGTTHLVLLQSEPDEYDYLHAAVFLPVLDAYAPLAPEATPVADYAAEEVTFTNGDVTLAGTLTLPEGEGPFPAVILVSGSGQQDRDESLPGLPIKPFRLIADELTNAGVAVLRYDDRGTAQSTGDYAASGIPDFADDAEAGLNYLLTRDEVDPDRLGLLGHSEGGLVAAMLGARNPDLDFIIAMAGPGVDGMEVLRLQNELIMSAQGATGEEIATQIEFLDGVFANLGDSEVIAELIYQNTLAAIEALPEEERAALGDVEDYARTMAEIGAAQFEGPWFQSFLEYDPAADWARTTVPVLAIFGGKDLQVQADQNAQPLADAVRSGGNDNVEIVILPEANHLFQAAETGDPEEYASLGAEFTPDFMPAILDWLRAQGIIGE